MKTVPIKFRISDAEIIQKISELLAIFDDVTTNEPESDKWRFSNFTANFNPIILLEVDYPNWALLLEFDIVMFSKLMFLTSIQSNRSSTIIRYKFDSIVKTLTFLAKSDLRLVDDICLQHYQKFMLMHGMYQGKIVERSTPLSSANFFAGISPPDWSLFCRRFQLPPIGIDPGIHQKRFDNSLKKVIEDLSGGGLSYGDWKDGGSFNKLTLDYGQYYVDHCINFFDANIGLAVALKTTLEHGAEVAEKAGLSVSKDSLKSYVMLIIGHFLAGKSIDQLSEVSRKRSSIDWLNKIQLATLQIFDSNLRLFSALGAILSETSISALLEKLAISENDRHKTQSALNISKTFLLHKYIIKDSDARTLLYCDLQSLKKAEMFQAIVDTVDLAFNKLLKNARSIRPSEKFFRDLGISENGSQSKYVLNFIRAVEDAGIVKFVALTGWRESEYGFSLQDIIVTKNDDAIDRLLTPSRFQINWKVPKTHGSAKVKREITREHFFTALQLSQLTKASGSDPCLYSYNFSAVHIHNSGEYIKRAVPKLWSNFFLYYPPFQTIRNIRMERNFSCKASLTAREARELEILRELQGKEDWYSIQQNVLLNAAFDRAEIEFSRVNFLLNPDSRRGFLRRFVNGQLAQKDAALMELYLSETSKSKLREFNSLSTFPPIFTREITDQITSGCLYPTPHALRHMWAEAVYRRFDGDVGWMIRSNFMHVSQTMWLTYIRDKENRRLHEPAKRAAISSMMHNYVAKKGAGYAGGTDKFLRRLFLNTHVSAIENLNEIVSNYSSSEIEDLKTNPWGACILRKRGRHYARCAENGEPQRFNAAPAYCLGCSFNLTQASNVEGILLGIGNDLNVLGHSLSPEIYKRESRKTVSNALHHLTKLQASPEILAKLRLALTTP